MYNMSNVTAGNNVYEIVKATNEVSSGFLFVAILFAVLIISLIVYQATFKARILAGSFITTIVGIMFFFLDFISWGVLIWPIILLFASIIIYKIND